MTSYHLLLFVKCLFLAVPAILFLQSGIDKIIDYKGNLEWLTGHFSKSVFKNMVKPLLITITILEVFTGALAVLSMGFVVTNFHPEIGSVVFLLSFFVLICLFLGQRIAKDYAGAASLINYMILFLLSLFIYAAISKLSSFFI